MATLLRDMPSGSVVKFAGGKDYILINPSQGLIYAMKSIGDRKFDKNNGYFKVDTVENIGYYLNNDFYNTLTAKEKAMIVTSNWNAGGVNPSKTGLSTTNRTYTISEWTTDEKSRVITAKVGLLSTYQFYLYSERHQGSSGLIKKDWFLSSNSWLLNGSLGNSGQAFTASLYGFAVVNSDTSLDMEVRPTMYLNPNLYVLEDGTVTTNQIPTVFLTTTNNQTIYENDTLNIAGNALDSDVGNSVTVRYQLNAEPARAIKAFISTGAVEAFSKSLTFKAGKLFDGETAVTDVLAEGVAHKLSVYATDDQGGTSPIVERTFYAVPNRAPALTVDAVTPSGIINTDAFDISGSYSDPDGNTTTVRYKINGSNPVQIANGTSGAWSFTLPLGKLVVGENTIVIEAEDTYGAKTSKTVKLRKQEVKTAVKTGVARYKIEPPTGTAQEVMLWVQHDANLTLDTSISMTQTAEAETYVPMALTNTATLSNGQVESEFYYNASAAQENIIVQITQTKTTADANEKITLISGVL